MIQFLQILVSSSAGGNDNNTCLRIDVALRRAVAAKELNVVSA